MDAQSATDILRETFQLFLVLSAPVLCAALVVGLIVGVMQAVTQVQEQTLSFVPKIVIMVAVAVFTMPWMLEQVMDFAIRMFGGMD